MVCTVQRKIVQTRKALENYDASVQQDNSGFNIAMHILTNPFNGQQSMLEVLQYALENKEAVQQKNDFDQTVFDMLDITMIEEFKDFNNQYKSNNGKPVIIDYSDDLNEIW